MAAPAASAIVMEEGQGVDGAPLEDSDGAPPEDTFSESEGEDAFPSSPRAPPYWSADAQGNAPDDAPSRAADGPGTAHRRTRSLRSVTLMRSPMKRTSAPSRSAESTTRIIDGSLLSALLDDARHSLSESRASLSAALGLGSAEARAPQYRRSLKWYGAAANLSTETMIPATFADTVAIDEMRCTLLETSRRLNPVDVVWRGELMLTASIIPRVIRSSVARVVFVTYIFTAVMKRVGAVSGGLEDATVLNLSVFVSFIIVFYSNHSYTRFYRQHESVKTCRSCINDAVALASALSESAPDFIKAPAHLAASAPPAAAPGKLRKETVEQLWRYLNLAHAAGYCALSPTYTRTNLFEPFVRRHGLLDSAERRAYASQRMDVEDTSAAAFHEFIQWALSTISAARDRGELQSANEMIALQHLVLTFRGAMLTLFDERFQEIPFAYSHLVSFVCCVYLLLLAVDMGLKCSAQSVASWLFPAIAVFYTTIVAVGLITVGKAMSQPTGLDPEAFPIFRYIDSTVRSSRDLILHDRPAARGRPATGEGATGRTDAAHAAAAAGLT
ncbi:Bestrophin, RFP-TM, chloride channel-domain-containing protein [Pelagophyceae sp. CCMP2097]|nr:Bestrophin, RFP-TM, chloride channel-domain-containing protein [Pelagophyceae sp. CCMP2097]|mmetsp:Transcript_1769/g.6457  ORF Transcript_1769/g.6457 Transcript_1769/m.6457 type:complete len:558 (+) Transcript_1769:102-1775(+)